MKSNEDLQKDVQDAIKWEPLLKAAEIGVTAKDGIVTLTGTVNSYSKKLEVEDATKNVVGVKAVVEKIVVHFGNVGKKEDAEIATDVLNALNWNWQVPNDKVKVKVEDGWVTLEGELHWNYQKIAARTAVSHLSGIKGITNDMIVKSATQDEIEKKDIEKAILRNWAIDSKGIGVEVVGNKVTLNGTVGSLYQKDQVERIAWNAPGVWNVYNELLVEYED